MEASNSPQKDYLYYVIRDNDQKIRGNIVGVQHWVKRGDKTLNPQIIDAIKRSSQAVLDMQPQSKLLPDQVFPGWVLDRVVKEIKPQGVANFIKAIKKNIFDYSLISLENNINKVIEENHVEIIPLEDIDLAALLKDANAARNDQSACTQK